MDVLAWSATPPLAARHQLAFDHALGAQGDGDAAVRPLRRGRHEDPHRLFQRGLHLGPSYHLREVRRANLLFAFGHEDEIQRGFAAGPADRVQRGEEGRFGAFLVHGAAPDDHLAEGGPVHERRRPGRRGPFRGIGLLDVVHEVEAERARRARVEGREDARLPVGRDLRDLPEARVLEHPHGEIAPLGHAAVFGGDGRLPDPFLQSLHGFVMTVFDLCEDRLEVIWIGGCLARQRERGGGRGGGGLEKGTAVDGHGTVSRVTGSRHLNLAGRWSVGNVDGPPFLRGRETGRSIWGASCGCDEFRGTL